MVKKTAPQPIPQKLNATQRIEALEQQLITLSSVVQEQVKVLAEDIDDAKKWLLQLNSKVKYVIDLAEKKGVVSLGEINELMIQEQKADLINKIKIMVEAGYFKLTQGPVTEDSFIVCNDETVKDQPVRWQSAVSIINPTFQSLFIGKSIGDTVVTTTNESNKEQHKIIEIYEVVNNSDIDLSFSDNEVDSPDIS